MAIYYPKKDYSSNLIAKWIFDDTNSNYINGNIIKDLSGKGNNLTAYNITFQNDTDLGRCAYFNGTDSYMMANNPVVPSGKKSIKFKFKCSTVPSTWNIILDTSSWDSSKKGFSVRVNPDGKLVVDNFSGNGMTESVPSSIFICDNKWHDIIFTWDGTSNADGMKLYIDDFINANKAYTSEQTNYESTYNLCIGLRCENHLSPFSGMLSELEIYNEVVGFTDKKYLIKNDNEYISIKPELYKQLGRPKDDNELQSWFKKYGTNDIIISDTNKITISQNMNYVKDLDDFKLYSLSIDKSVILSIENMK